MLDDSIMKQVYRKLLTLSDDGHDNSADRFNSLFVKFNILRSDLDSMSLNDLDNFYPIFVKSDTVNSWLIGYMSWTVYPKIVSFGRTASSKRTFALSPTFCASNTECTNGQWHRQLRVSSHKLQIEVGRHSLPTLPIGGWLCTYCQQNIIDDENHFMMTCHDVERKKCFGEY